MKTNIQQYYRKSDDVKTYLITNKKRVKKIRNIYKSNRKYFGKKILDIGCGGGILGFLIESNGHKYTGLDINPDMIKNAKKHAKEIKSKNKFILGDATKKKINGTFNTITSIGNGLCHITTHDFLNILKNIKKNSKKGTHFLIEYRDVVGMLFRKEWKYKMIEKSKGKTLTSLTIGASMKEGEIYKKSFDKNGQNKIFFTHTIWSPFIMEPIMNSDGWKLLKRKKNKRWKGWLEIYKRVR